jgi:murein L,D-transpeptidase YcbB/YkuD
MNKLAVSCFACCLALAACNNNTKGEEGENNSDKPNSKNNISARDYSITSANSYSDLFFDSTSMQNFIASNKVPDSLSNRLLSFYNTRNYQYAWFTSKGFTEQALAFWNLLDHHITYAEDTAMTSKPLKKKINYLLSQDSFSVQKSDKSFLETEWRLTLSLFNYVSKNFEKGYVKRKELERFVPFKKQDPFQWADSLLNKKHKDNKYFDEVNASYKALKEQLRFYAGIHQKGDWPQIPAIKKPLKKGMSTPEIPVLKKYLAITGDMPGYDTTQLFNDTLLQAVKSIQQRFGFTPSGIITKDLVKEMNVPLKQRMEQMLINIDRMRWMPSQPNGTLIVVNIPAFKLDVLENGSKAFDMDVVVGKEGHNTMQFAGTLNQVVFSPYWNVPPDIVVKEILPELEKDPAYLSKNEMENQGDKDGDGIPEIRQLPGTKNALGKVKFLFPNSFDIYFHDTPAKTLFAKDKRAFSHGCIRLSEPEKMAEYLLRDDPDWDATKINEAMNAGKEKFVRLKNKAGVFITYYTAWSDGNGKLNFREDIYGHDKEVISRLFE